MQKKRAGERPGGNARKERSDKKHRVAPSLDQETFELLVKLAAACSAGGFPVSWAGLAEIAIRSALHSPEFVKWVQQEHRTPDDFRVIPHSQNAEIKYVVRGG